MKEGLSIDETQGCALPSKNKKMKITTIFIPNHFLLSTSTRRRSLSPTRRLIRERAWRVTHGTRCEMDFIAHQFSKGADLLFKKDQRMEALLHPSPDDLDGLDMSIESLRGPSGTAASPDVVFQYSAALISHVNPQYIKEGITLMEGLVFQHWQQERRRAAKYAEATSSTGLCATAPPTSEPELDELARKHKETVGLLPIYYYYIALGWIKLEDPHKAKSSVSRMLQLEPDNPQGLALGQYIDQQQTKDGVIGLAGLSAAIAAAAVVVGVLRK
jgi:hypothetical protein